VQSTGTSSLGSLVTVLVIIVIVAAAICAYALWRKNR
jgi:hypothetical protein